MPRKKKEQKKSHHDDEKDHEIIQVQETDDTADTVDQSSSHAETPSVSTSAHHEDLKALIEKNIKWSQVIYNQNKKIRRRLTMMVLGSYLRLALILLPLIFALIYLPPLLKEYMDQYGALLGGTGSDTSTLYNLGTLLQAYGLDGTQVQGLLENMK